MIKGQPPLPRLEPTEGRNVDVCSIGDLLEREPEARADLSQATTRSHVDGLLGGACHYGKQYWQIWRFAVILAHMTIPHAKEWLGAVLAMTPSTEAITPHLSTLSDDVASAERGGISSPFGAAPEAPSKPPAALVSASSR